MTIFHNHIPRTSGFILNKFMANQDNISSYLVDPAGQVDDKELFNKDYIAGHIGNYPQLFLDDVISFSLVRNPYDQFISWFYFMWLQGVEWFDGDVVSSYYGTPYVFMDRYLNGDEFLDGISNIQTKFITGSIDKDLWNQTPEPIDKTKKSWCLKDYTLSETAIDDAIEKNLVYTVENRELLKHELEQLFINRLGKTIKIQDFEAKGHNHPKNHKYMVDFPASWKTKIMSHLELDLYLYNRLVEREKKML